MSTGPFWGVTASLRGCDGSVFMGLQPKTYRFDPVPEISAQGGYKAVQHRDTPGMPRVISNDNVLSWGPPCLAR